MRSVLDLLWPRACEVCGRPADRPGRHVCSACLMRVPFLPTTGCCRCCAYPLEGSGGEALCGACTGADRPAFDRAASAFRFEGKAREMLLGYKFEGRLWLRDDFADWLEAAARARFDVAAVDLVVPMPQTLFHRLDRGYDPCGSLAEALGRRFDRRVGEGALVRTGHPRRQADLPEEDRRANVRGTFAVARPEAVAGRTLLLVDDVMTTGSTLDESARTLKAAGAARVWCLTLARSIR